MATHANVRFRVRVSGPEADLRGFLAEHPLETQRVIHGAGRVRVDVSVDESLREELKRRGFRIEDEIDLFENLLRRRREIEPADRFDHGSLPVGIGRLLR